MSQFIKFYFASSMLNMFRTLIHPSPGACDFYIVSSHWLCVLVSMCVGVSVWLVGVVSVWQAEAVCRSFLLKMRNVSNKFADQIKTRILCLTLFFSENCTVYDIC